MAVYDSLLQNFGDSTIPIVQVLCAMALRNKGVMLGEKLNNPQGAVAVYDSLRQRFGDSVIPTVQEQSVTVLVSKCVTLGRMDDLAGAIACYDDLLARYGQSENPVIRSQCQLALANMAELLLVLGKNEEAIPRIRQVLARTDATNLRFAILNFLLWLAEEADATQDDVLVAIRALSPTVEFTWVWDDIRLMLTQFPEPRKTQAECFIAFFEQHHDIAQLESCLTNCEINRSS
jgi:tetratricopeptide (TPR) repeat protein